MTYKDSKLEPLVGDKVLGEAIKGTVAEVKDKTVTVTTKGPWDPRKDTAGELRTEVDPATLVLLHRKAK